MSDQLVTPPVLSPWRSTSRVVARPNAMHAARAAMRMAVREANAAPYVPEGLRDRILGAIIPRTSHLLRGHPLRLSGGCAAAAAVAVVVVGWNAGPGSPLHSVQQVRENASLVMTTGSQAAALRLGYAESRLRDASRGSALGDNLAEATSLLDAARADLPADHADPLWLRWERDEQQLTALARDDGAPSHGSRPSSGGDHAAASGSAGDDGPTGTGSPDGDSGGRGDGSRTGGRGDGSRTGGGGFSSGDGSGSGDRGTSGGGSGGRDGTASGSGSDGAGGATSDGTSGSGATVTAGGGDGGSGSVGGSGGTSSGSGRTGTSGGGTNSGSDGTSGHGGTSGGGTSSSSGGTSGGGSESGSASTSHGGSSLGSGGTSGGGGS